MKKQATKKNDKEYDRLVADISKMAKALAGLYEQSCALLKPTIDDACRNPSSYSEKEIERIFDQIQDVSCYKKGKRLFDRLCKCFMPIYPDAVRFYIDSEKEMYGDENDEGALGNADAQAHICPCRAKRRAESDHVL